MYQVKVFIKDGKIQTASEFYLSYYEEKYGVYIVDLVTVDEDFIDGDEIDRIRTLDPEGVIVPEFFTWTFNPDVMQEFLISRVLVEIHKRINYVNSIKHLI